VLPVWRNELGGTTFRVGEPAEAYVKWAPAGSGLDLDAEAARLRWAGAATPVPEVLEVGTTSEGAWMVTEALGAGSAVAPRWLAEPAVAVAALGAGLRSLHDALVVDGCPFSWSIAERKAAVMARGRWDPSGWHAEHRSMGLAGAFAALDDEPPVDRLVVCHGDACAPNTILDGDGRWVGHVDLGALGVADRWADLAVATWSLDWNYGSGWEPAFYSAYEVDPDPARVAYYRLLWDLT
jgi:kanamycin kinase